MALTIVKTSSIMKNNLIGQNFFYYQKLINESFLKHSSCIYCEDIEYKEKLFN